MALNQQDYKAHFQYALLAKFILAPLSIPYLAFFCEIYFNFSRFCIQDAKV